MLAGRSIVLGISGGVAAYKAAYLARRLIESGAAVRCVMTASSTAFIGPQTLAAITGRQPLLDLFGNEEVSPHTSLAHWADGIVVAPATAATLARLASGLAEDALSATVLAARCRVVIAPAMHTEMWEHPATQANVERLVAYGYRIVAPDSGPLAGGDTGLGRLADPDRIVDELDDELGGPGPMTDWTVLVNAGGTREAIDPVRYIGNRSSGKMGNAVALSAAARGARVTLVTTAAAPDSPFIDVVRVESAAEMAAAVWKLAPDVDVAVLTAAVADFRPVTPADDKLQRTSGLSEIRLEPTPDILAGVAAMDGRPYLVGFAAQVGSLEAAVVKATEKGTDLLVANDVAKPGSGFGTDTNEVVIIRADGTTEAWELMSKRAVADRLWDVVIAAKSDGTPT